MPTVLVLAIVSCPGRSPVLSLVFAASAYGIGFGDRFLSEAIACFALVSFCK
ncbi:MAG: hypothetical protein F6J93_27730 [Oscillatoria sp. SIO1A7]|nr:hypothetical protein [Oscillatoria sp. SIO1A7]